MKDHTKITHKQLNFYETLFSEKINQHNSNYTENQNTFLHNNNIRRLSDKQKDFCERPVSQDEILKTIKELSNREQTVFLLNGTIYFGSISKVLSPIASYMLFVLEHCQLSRKEIS